MKAKQLIPVLVGLVLAHGWLQAQTTEVAGASATLVPTAAAPADGAPHTSTEAPKKIDTLSVDFPDDDIRTILRNVADLFELNLVVPDTLQGKTSIKLRDVSWRQIFKVVLNPVGFTYVEEGNIIRVVTMESLNQEPAMTEVFILNYAKASDVKPSVDPLIETKAGGRIVVDSRSNALIVTERPSTLNRIRPIINTLDKPTDQVMIETKFIDVTDGDQKNIGVNWASLQGYGIGTEGKVSRSLTDTVTNNRVNNSGFDNKNTLTNDFSNNLKLTETNLESDHILASKAKLDSITGSNTYPITPKSFDANGNVTEWNGGGGSTRTTTFDDTNKNTNILTGVGGVNYSDEIKRITTAVLSADQFRVVLSALNTSNRSRLVSNPTVVTLNNTEANINIGREFPIPNYTYNQERGVFEVSGFTYKPIGVILKVTPQVNAAGFIRLSVEPEVSSSNESVTFGGSGGASIPIIQVRKTKTQITLKDGFTLGIGGLVEQNTQKVENKVPVLGDIPGLGRLFRSKSDNLSVHNLVVFITAKTVKPDGASVGEIFDPRVTRSMQITKDEMPGTRDGSDPFYTPPPPEEKGKKKKKKAE